MTLTQKAFVAALITVSIGVTVYALAALRVEQLNAQVGQGLQANVATSSTMVVGPQQDKTLFTENELCRSRVISTVGASAIMLSFHTAIDPGEAFGHVQAASTTVDYPADHYGCGTVTAYGFASSTITTAELR